ncbi:DUF2390 domain-containing protein [Shewanella zhangzhouensis]|nr:DUF2390 domain-containing protein [Shewanella zhangzhouensis]
MRSLQLISEEVFTRELWQACEAHYSQHEALCLSLQDDCQINVNLLLLASELDRRCTGLNQGQWQLLIAEVTAWDERLIGPYRRLRQLAKNSLSEEEYRQMLDVELMMERKVQNLLLHRLNQLPTSRGEANNLMLLLAEFGLDIEVAAALIHQG